MDIFIIREGHQTGPFSEDAVKSLLAEGSVRPADMGWRKGMAEWQALSEVLKPRTEQPGAPATPPAHASNGASGEEAPATAKQKAFLKYLGAEFGENLTKQRAALAVSDAFETPRLQVRIRKWQDDKMRMHPDMFQDEIDYRRANRSNRYLERLQTEGAEVLKDVTKAHVQVLVESLDKRQPSWESEPESALWNHLLPAVAEHFPQLVLPAGKARLKTGGGKGGAATRGMAAAGLPMPPQPTGTLGAMLRGVVLGAIALGAILGGYHYWQQGQGGTQGSATPTPAPTAPEKKETPPATIAANENVPKEPAANEPPAKEPAAPLPEKMIAEAKPPVTAPENPPAPVPEPAPAAPKEPSAPAVPAMNTEKPATPATQAEKPATPAAPTVPAPAPAEPAAMNTPPAAPAPVAPPPPPPQRNAVRLTQGIGVMLPNGQVALPAGTILRYLATEGPNVRVSWNNNVFFVPAIATDVNDPPATPGAPATPAAPQPAKKPADDL